MAAETVEIFPRAQAWQAGCALVLEKKPGLHSVHAVALLVEDFPGEHAEHAVLCAALLKYPGAHAVQTPVVFRLKVPG